MRTLLIDNYDSYTFNLFHLLGEVNDSEPVVVRNDELAWEELAALGADNVVISPGPGRPERARDAGVSLDALRRAEVPVLGVCLGHQALAHVAGGTVVHAPEVMHGRLSPIQHDESALFAGIPQDFLAVRYHSLVVGAVPAELRVSAWTPDGVVMGLEHRARPLFGVQFHPESVSTRHGRRLIENFRDLTRARREPAARRLAERRAARPAASAGQVGARVHHRRLETWCEPEAVFATLYGDHDHAVWLDSATEGPGLGQFSFVGAPDGPLGEVVRYDVETRTLVVERHSGRELRSESVLDYCRDRLAAPAGRCPRAAVRLHVRLRRLPRFRAQGRVRGPAGARLAVAGRGAHALRPADRLRPRRAPASTCSHSPTPPARRRPARGLPRPPSGWARSRASRRRCHRRRLPPGTLRFELHDSPEAYLANIAACRREIIEGETYEVCLTTELRSDASLDPLRAYRALRARNPAPFAALLRLGEQSVLSSSPERFLRVDRDGVVESRPMKGTAARVAEPFEDACRAAELRRDKKTRAENLMIADLVRNDLGRVSALGTVEVPALMVVEPYATVHQMVTVVRGRLREGSDAIDCVRAAFPPGSMTGAPKLRTLEIIDRIEGRPRGVYSGALGFFAVNGTADLNVVIRTLVASPDGLRIGAGGAIVAASDPEAELEEMLLKARPLLNTVGGTLEVGSDLAVAHR